MTDPAQGPSEDGAAGSEDGEAGAGAPEAGWCLVVMAAVRVELPAVHAELSLRETQAPWRELCIPVGFSDGRAIAYAWRGVATPRPLTHELLRTVLELHGVHVEAVRITERHGGRFLAELDTVGPGGHHVVPCRPSDAVALALRQRMPTPILVAEPVFAADEPEMPVEDSGPGPGEPSQEAGAPTT